MSENTRKQMLMLMAALMLMFAALLVGCIAKDGVGDITSTVADSSTPQATTPILSDPVTTTTAFVPSTTASQPITTTTLPITTTAVITTSVPITTTAVITTTVPATTVPVTTTAPVTTAPSNNKDPNRKLVAFSFDDGPNNSLTYKFVDKLKEYGATATFFVVGNRMGKNNGAALQYAVDNGCDVGLHSYAHDYYNKMSMEEYLEDLSKTEAAIKKYVNVDIRLMRPPGGILSTAQKEACPYTVVKWSVDSNDWKYKSRNSQQEIEKNVQTIVNNVMSVIKEGDIVLMHELYQNSYEAFCIIIEQLYEQGYEIVTVSELLGEERIIPGTLYYNGR